MTQVEAMVAQTVATLGKLDVANNNAGVQNVLAESAGTTREYYDRVVFRCRLPRRRAEGRNPSQREVIINVARTWAKTAEMIDRRVGEGWGEVLSDLRHKLN